MKSSDQWIENIKTKVNKNKKRRFYNRSMIALILIVILAITTILSVSIMSRERYPFCDILIDSMPEESSGNGSSEAFGSTSTDTSSTEEPVRPVTGTPSWYLPGDLKVISVVKRSLKEIKSDNSDAIYGLYLNSNDKKSISKPHELAVGDGEELVYLPPDMLIKQNIYQGTDFIAIESAPGIPEEYGIYFDIKNQELICFSSAAGEAASIHGIVPENGSVRVHYEDPGSGNCIIEVMDNQAMPQEYYLYNIYDDTLYVFPIKLHEIITLDISKDKQHYTAAVMTGDAQDEVIMVDISGGKPVEYKISKNDKVNFFITPLSSFSENGRFIYYNIFDENDELYDPDGYAHTAVYNIEDGTTVTFTGDLIRFINDDDMLIIQNGSGTFVIDPKTGNDITETAVLEEWQKYKTSIKTGNYYNNYKSSVYMHPLFGNGESILVAEYADAVYISGRYIYYYNDGGEHITCYDMENGHSFTAIVSMEFINQLKEIDRENYRPVYHLEMNRDKTKILLLYTLVKNEYHEEIIDESLFAEKFKEAGCLSDLDEFIRYAMEVPFDTRNSTYIELNLDRVYFIKGEGYSSIMFDAGHWMVAVEDYRDRTFALYITNGGAPWEVIPNIYSEYIEATKKNSNKPYRKELTTSAGQKYIEDLFGYLNKVEPYYDYADFYTDGKIDLNKFNVLHRLQKIGYMQESTTNSYISDFKTYVGSISGWDVFDTDSLYQLYEKVAELSKTADFIRQKEHEKRFSKTMWSTAELPVFYRINTSRYNEFSRSYYESYLFYIGISAYGEYYIGTHAGCAVIDKATFDEYMELCVKMFESAREQIEYYQSLY